MSFTALHIFKVLSWIEVEPSEATEMTKWAWSENGVSNEITDKCFARFHPKNVGHENNRHSGVSVRL